MEILVSVIGMVVAAFSIWLTIRFINRKEPWAKWTLMVMAIVLVGYPLSSGPADWLLVHGYTSKPVDDAMKKFYAPAGWVIRNSPKPVQDSFNQYFVFCASLGNSPQPRKIRKKRAVNPPAQTQDNPSESH